MRRVVVAAAILLVALPLFAGTTEPNPSKRQRELVEKLFAQINIDKTTNTLMDAVFGQVQKQFLDDAAAKGNDPADIEEATELFTAFRATAAKIDFGGLMHEEYLRIYAKYFTEQEIIDLTAFYATPTGKKAMDMVDELMNEGMQAGAQELAPKIEEAMKQAMEQVEKKRPWRRTMADMRTVATAVEAYATDENAYPAGDYDRLKEVLVPVYIKELPKEDMWGHAYAYVVSDDRQHYRVVSAGADSIFEWDSRRIVVKQKDPKAAAGAEGESMPDTRYVARLEEDLIFEDGTFLQAPIQAKPKWEQ